MHATRVAELANGPSGITNITIPRMRTVQLRGGRFTYEHPPIPGRIVYYLERSDGLIKIGTTTGLRARRRHLSYEHGPLSLLAWEIGSYTLERQRHDKFQQLRDAPNTEWFNPGRQLLGHVGQLRVDNLAALEGWA
jgi:hypothetical protein